MMAMITVKELAGLAFEKPKSFIKQFLENYSSTILKNSHPRLEDASWSQNGTCNLTRNYAKDCNYHPNSTQADHQGKRETQF